MVQRACHAAVADPTTKTALEFKRPHAPPQGWKIAHAANIPLTEPVNVRAWLTCSPCGLEMSLWKIVLCIQEVYPSNDDDLYTHLMMLACRCGGTAPPSALWGMSGGRRGTWRCRYGRHHCSGIAWKHKKGCGTAGAIALAWDARMLYMFMHDGCLGTAGTIALAWLGRMRYGRHHYSGMAWKDAVYQAVEQSSKHCEQKSILSTGHARMEVLCRRWSQRAYSSQLLKEELFKKGKRRYLRVTLALCVLETHTHTIVKQAGHGRGMKRCGPSQRGELESPQGGYTHICQKRRGKTAPAKRHLCLTSTKAQQLQNPEYTLQTRNRAPLSNCAMTTLTYSTPAPRTVTGKLKSHESFCIMAHAMAFHNLGVAH
eukprot:1161627-Pelagomonas_calceolata.AAC.5